MAKIILKSASRATSVPRSVIRSAIAGNFRGVSDISYHVSNTSGFHTIVKWAAIKTPKKAAKKAAKKVAKKAAKKVAKKAIKRSAAEVHTTKTAKKSIYKRYFKKAAKKK